MASEKRDVRSLTSFEDQVFQAKHYARLTGMGMHAETSFGK